MATWETFKPTAFADRVRADELFDSVSLTSTPKKWMKFRLVGEPRVYAQYWFELAKVSEKTNKRISVPRIPLNFDPSEDGFTKDPCPYQDLLKDVREKEVGHRFDRRYYSNAIMRLEQENEPAKKGKPTPEEAESGFKAKGTKWWTPVKVIPLPSSLASKIIEMISLNEVTTKKAGTKTYPPHHKKYGFDIMVKYDPDKKGTDVYTVQMGDKTELTEEELEYPLYDLSLLDSIVPVSFEDAKKDAKELRKELYSKTKKSKPLPEDFDEDDEDEAPKKKKKKPVEDDDDDDDAPAPKSKKKRVADDDDDDDAPAPKSKKKRVVEDDDDDEDETPKAKKKKKPVDDDDGEDEPAPKKKKKPVDDDDDEDEPAPKKKKKPVDDDDDEEDEPKPKKKKKPVDDDDDEEDEPKPKKKKRPVEDDEDEEDEPKPKKKKRPVEDDDDDDEVPKPKKKKKRSDDDDDDDLPF